MDDQTDETLRVVVFDLDDTIFPERDYVRSGYGAVAQHLRRTLAVDGPFEHWLWERFLEGRFDRAFDGLNHRFNLSLTPQQIADLVTVYRNHTPNIRPRDGMIDLLVDLRRSFDLAMISDGFLPAQQLKVEALGIEAMFDHIVFTARHGREFWKPSRLGFELVQHHFDVDHAACAYVGDNVSKDFVAPNALGWLTVQLAMPDQVHREKTSPRGGGPRIRVRSVEQLRAALMHE